MLRTLPTSLVAATALSFAVAGCGSSDQAASAKTGAAGSSASSKKAVLWSKPLGGAVVPGPVVTSGGQLLAASNAGKLLALDPATGKTRWSFDGGAAYGSDLSTSPLVLRDGTIAWPGPSNTLFGLSPAGKLLWKVGIGAQPLTPAAGHGSRIYVEDMAGKMHAIDATAAGARQVWSTAVGAGTSYGSAEVGPNGNVYTTINRDLVAVADHGTTGAVAWKFAVGGTIEVSPAVASDGTVVVGTNDRYQYGIGPTGHQRWRYLRGPWSYSSTAIDRDDHAYFGDHHGNVTVVDAKTGARVGVDHGTGQVWTKPAIGSQGQVYFGTHSGWVHGFTATGASIFAIHVGGSVESYPAVGPTGTVYIGSDNGTLYALKG